MNILNYPMTRAVMAEQVYKITRQSFAIWLHDIGITHSRTLSPAEIKKIIATYGLSGGVEIRGL